MTLAIENENELCSYRGPDGEGWICDHCGETIRTAGEGWVQWAEVPAMKSGGPKVPDLSLVHHFASSPRKNSSHRCLFDEEYKKDGSLSCDSSLDSLCGADGLVKLLSFLGEKGFSRMDVAKLVMRINTPGYERARFHLDRAIAEGVIEPNMPEGFHLQRDIRAVLAWADEQDD